MNFLKNIVLALAILAAPAMAAEDASRFQLSPALMQKLVNAEAEMKLLRKGDNDKPDEGPEGKDKSIDAAIRRIDADPHTTAVLAKHGLSSRDLVLSTHALYHAGMYLSTEGAMDRKQSAALFDSYTSEQKANINMIRDMQKMK